MPDYTGSFSGSFEGNGSNLTNISYPTLANKPITISTFQGNSILANSAFRDNFVSNVKDRLDAEMTEECLGNLPIISDYTSNSGSRRPAARGTPEMAPRAGGGRAAAHRCMLRY